LGHFLRARPPLDLHPKGFEYLRCSLVIQPDRLIMTPVGVSDAIVRSGNHPPVRPGTDRQLHKSCRKLLDRNYSSAGRDPLRDDLHSVHHDHEIRVPPVLRISDRPVLGWPRSRYLGTKPQWTLGVTVLRGRRSANYSEHCENNRNQTHLLPPRGHSKRRPNALALSRGIEARGRSRNVEHRRLQPVARRHPARPLHGTPVRKCPLDVS